MWLQNLEHTVQVYFNIKNCTLQLQNERLQSNIHSFLQLTDSKHNSHKLLLIEYVIWTSLAYYFDCTMVYSDFILAYYSILASWYTWVQPDTLSLFNWYLLSHDPSFSLFLRLPPVWLIDHSHSSSRESLSLTPL